MSEQEAGRSLRESTGFPGIDPNPVARAIEDLERSGYRPLRLQPEALGPAAPPGAPTKGATWKTAQGPDAGEPSPVKGDES